MTQTLDRRKVLALGLVGSTSMLCTSPAWAKDNDDLLNVSFSTTTGLYTSYDKLFAADWQKKTGNAPKLRVSYGASGAQARAVMEGLPADVVTLAVAFDIDAIAKRGLIASNWQSRLPDNSTPYASTVVFLVRKGNPKQIKDWDDLVRPGVQVAVPNPKTSGGARWDVLAAWSYALRKYGSEAAAKTYLQKFFANVPVLSPSTHDTTLNFTQRGVGDVLVGLECEAFEAIHQAGPAFEIIVPSLSIKAESPVAVVDKNVDRRGTRAFAQAYLEQLYSPAAQEAAAQNFFRPVDATVLSKYAHQFPNVEMVSIDSAFGGWAKAQATFFANGGIFDQVYAKGV